MKVFLLVISMIGINEDGDRLLIGSQMVLNQEMTAEQCNFMAHDERWSKHFENEYYEMQLSCHEKGTELKNR